VLFLHFSFLLAFCIGLIKVFFFWFLGEIQGRIESARFLVLFSGLLFVEMFCVCVCVLRVEAFGVLISSFERVDGAVDCLSSLASFMAG
jgi:hypothetical protein